MLFGKKVKDVELEGTVAEGTQDQEETKEKKGFGTKVFDKAKKAVPAAGKLLLAAAAGCALYALGTKSKKSDGSDPEITEAHDDNVVNVDFGTAEETVD